VNQRRLGSDGPEISVVGLGAWAIGGPWEWGWGATDDAESVATIRRAIESGVSWIDTAAVYGHGHSEQVVGTALRELRPGEHALVFTKCGQPYTGPDGRTYGENLRPESIRAECEQSLRRLGIERIDLYQFHWPDPGTPVEESWGTMAELVDEGKVRWIGFCNATVQLLERCEAVRHVDSLQPPFNMLQPEAREDLIPWCRAHGTGVIAYSPMASGLLTGAFDRRRMENLAPDDWRRRSALFQEPTLTEGLELVDRLRPIAARLDCSLASLAVAWTLATPGVSGAIVGARRPAQVDDWLPAGDLDLGGETVDEIEQLLG
jgi:aryl-alcohol dehydrogenase-like predicted oxidoreductase